MNAGTSADAFHDMLEHTIRECCAADVVPKDLDAKIHNIVKCAREKALQVDYDSKKVD